MKKKLVFMVILVLCANTMVFSNENRLSMGFEYGNFFEKRTDSGVDIETYRGSPGFDFSGYHLWDNFGFLIGGATKSHNGTTVAITVKEVKNSSAATSVALRGKKEYKNFKEWYTPALRITRL